MVGEKSNVQQAVLDTIKRESETTGSRPKAAICVVCHKFHPECLNLHYATPTGRTPDKKARICPSCFNHAVRTAVGSGLEQISPTALDVFNKVCPLKAVLSGGPENIRIKMPTTEGQLVGLAVHKGLELMGRADCNLGTLMGQYGVGGFLGNIIANGQVTVLRTVPDIQRATEKAKAIVRCALRHRHRVKPKKLLKEEGAKSKEKDYVYSNEEQHARITLSTLLDWAGIPWEGYWDGTEAVSPFDVVFSGVIDRIVVWEREGELEIIITDYKSFVPDDTYFYKRYTQSIQLRMYGLWAAWTFDLSPEQLDQIKLNLFFLNEKECDIRNVKFAYNDPAGALRTARSFLTRYQQVAQARKGTEIEIAKKHFPKNPGDRCQYCSYHGVWCAGADKGLQRLPVYCICGTELEWNTKRKMYYCPECNPPTPRQRSFWD